MQKLAFSERRQKLNQMLIADKFLCDNKTLQELRLDKSSRPEVFCKKGVLRNFAKFTGKHQCQSHFLNNVAAGLGLQLY